jgi:hypothetical protein
MWILSLVPEQEKKDKRSVQRKEWKSKNQEKVKQRMKEFFERNPNYNKEWKSKNADHVKEYEKEYKATPRHPFNYYKRGAKVRGIDFRITFEEFLLFWNKPCHYCGDDIQTAGLDRIDNGVGYLLNNIVPCCTVCNFAKASRATEDFISHCKKVANHQGKKQLCER